MTHRIPVTQYVLPHGRRRQEYFVTSSDALMQKAQAILDHGWRFEAEVLTTGDVSVTVTSDERDVDIEVFPNEPGGSDGAMTRLIDRAHARIGA